MPHVTMNFAFLLGVASLAVLISFIHHLARSLQVTNVILDVACELDAVIDRCMPDAAQAAEPGGEADLPGPPCESIAAGRTGYVQAIDEDGLFEAACSAGLAVECVCRAGDLVIEGAKLARLYGEEPDEETRGRVLAAFIIGAGRTATQDPEFVLNELVEIAVRALSPGVNDPFTAVSCVDHIAAALCRAARREMPVRTRRDDAGWTRVVLERTSFTGICNSGFDQIRQHARSDVAVTVRLLEGLTKIAEQTRTAEQRDAVRRQARMILQGAQALPEPLDREAVEERFADVEKALASDRTDGD
jgi:uncharacterized membrane protein